MTTMSKNTSSSSSEPFSLLCNALELGKTERAMGVLSEHGDTLELSRMNEDGFTPLELVFMMEESGRRSLTSSLMAIGEQRIVERRDGDVEARLKALLIESKRQVEKFGQLRKSASSTSSSSKTSNSSMWPSSLTSDQLRECAKQQGLWSKRCTTLTKMLTNWTKCGRPHAPDQIQVSVVNKGCVELALLGLLDDATHCRVQWSRHATFREIEGEKLISLRSRAAPYCLRISSLPSHRRLFLRLSLGSPRGFGPFCMATPASFVASSWRRTLVNADLKEKANERLENPERQERLEQLLQAILRLTEEHGNSSPSLEESKENLRKGGLFRQWIGNVGNGNGNSNANLLHVNGWSRLSRSLTSNRVYLAHTLFYKDKVLLSADDSLPVVEVCEFMPNLNLVGELAFLFRLTHVLSERLVYDKESSKNNCIDIRTQLVRAVGSLATLVDEPEGSVPYCRPIVVGDNIVVLCLIKRVNNERVSGVINNGLKWTPIARAKHNQEATPMDALRSRLRDLLVYTQRLSSPLPARGLLLCLVQGETHVGSRKGVEVRVDQHWPMLPPFVVVRENKHVSNEEWEWLRGISSLGHNKASKQGRAAIEAPSPTTNFLSGEEEDLCVLSSPTPHLHSDDLDGITRFGQQLWTAANRLMDEVGLDEQSRTHMRVYTDQIHELSSDLSVIYLLPSPSSVVVVSSSESSSSSSWLSLTLQEHLSSRYFSPSLTPIESRITVLLQLWMHRARRQLRVALGDEEGRVAKSLLDSLETYKTQWERFGQSQLSLSNVIHSGREKSSGRHCVSLANVNVGLDELRRVKLMKPRHPLSSSLSSSSSAKSRQWAKQSSELVRFNSSRSEPLHYANVDSSVVLRKNSREENELNNANNVLQVYAAYETGLASGTSVKLTISALTSAREVVDLVVRQLNMALLLKGRDGPVYGPEQLQDFCLVAVIGSRERGLRDDFKPLHLQNPWKKGKLFVRRKDDFANNNLVNSSVGNLDATTTFDIDQEPNMSAIV